MDQYKVWLNEAKSNNELKKLMNKLDRSDVKDAFNGDLEFGTGGIRGVMGAGTNRLNIFTLRKANAGFGMYLLKTYKDEISRGVVVSHDNRFNSREFAIDTCRVLGAYGIKCYMFDDLRTTPELSFSVRYLNTIAGVMITASHNPKEYNGYKIYDDKGCQYVPAIADKVIEEVNKITDIFSINTLDIDIMEKMGLYKILGKEVDDAFLNEAKSVMLNNDLEKNIKVVYTPLHGTGAMIAKRALLESGYDAYFVKEQMEHDSSFKTVKLPNPEDVNAFTMAEELGREMNADLLIATDPDADRVGIGVLYNNEYHYLTGNQTGALLINYRFSELEKRGELPKNGKIFNTIVTSELGAVVARSFNIPCFSTLTGFKFIGEQAGLLDGTKTKYLFGYEESYGYLIKDYARDKDSIQSLLLIADMANYYKTKENKTLVEVLEDVYRKFGYYQEYTKNLFFEGASGKDTMKNITNYFRTTDIPSFGSYRVLVKEDYKLSVRTQLSTNIKTDLTLPKSDVIKYYLDGGSWLVVRPSGTEPKLKIYFSCKGESTVESMNTIKELETVIDSIIEKLK